MDVSRRALLQLTAGAAIAPATAAPAPTYPSRPVRIVVGFPAGGPLDIAARTVAPFLARRFGVEFVVENLPGASGNTATRAVVRAAPDGHTLLLCGPVNVINTVLFDDLDFDFAADIVPIGLIASVPLIVEVAPGFPARSVPALLAFARSKPARLRVAFAGIGTPQHIAIALFESLAGVTVTLVPYPGSAAALADLLLNKADAMFDPAPSSLPLVRAGRLVPLATTGLRRSDALPDVPALAEFVPGYAASSWFGLGAPRGTPDGIVAVLNAALNDSLADAAVAARFRELGATLLPGTPAAFGAFIAAETEQYRRIIGAAGIEPG